MRKIIVIGIVSCVLGCFILWKIANSKSFQFFGEIIPRVSTTEKIVALSFDDGPSPNVPEILSILRENDIKATFFVTGKELEENMREGQLLAAAGHEIGNHAYSHARMVLKSLDYVKKEIEKTDELIRRTGYRGEILFRPPYAKKLFGLPLYLSRNNRKTITWDIEPDSIAAIADSSGKIIDHVLVNAKPGSIILLHPMYDSRRETVQAIAGIVTGLKKQGYRFATVSELLTYGK
jgi:chitin deacetylase